MIVAVRQSYTQPNGYMGCTGPTGPNEPAPVVTDEDRARMRQQNQKVDEELACRVVIQQWLDRQTTLCWTVCL